MTEDSAGDWGCDCPNRGATGTPGVSTKVCPAEDMESVKRRTIAGNAIRMLVMANLPSPAWACRGPSSYLQRYQKSSVKDSFSFRRIALKYQQGLGRLPGAADSDHRLADHWHPFSAFWARPQRLGRGWNPPK